MLKKIFTFFYFHKKHRMSPEQVRKYQEKRLQKIVRHAYDTTAFYRDWFDRAGVRPEDIKTPADLGLIPPITKDHIQKNMEAFISSKYDLDKCLMRTTSGSSGKILRVLWDQYNFLTRLFLYYRAWAMIGYSPFRKLVYFLPVIEDTGVRFGLFKQIGITLDTPFETIKEILLDFRPDVMAIYPSYAIDLGSHLTEDDVKKIGLKAVSLNSEMILPRDRALVEEIYKCPVYEEYSSVEFGMIATMCKDKGMHIFSDNVVLEILDNDGNQLPPGEVGEVTLTALNSFGMPFIRYGIGDYSSIREGACTCGSGLPMLGWVMGRKDDSFVLKDDRRVPAWQIYEVVERPLEEYGMEKLVLADFFLVQKELDRAEFYYVSGPDFESGYIDGLREKSRELFGDDFTVDIKELNDISRVKNVKRKYIHCEVPGR